jgi:hypothetical protein
VSDIDINQLLSTIKKFIQRNPKIWESHEALGPSCKKAGPLPEKQIEFIKMQSLRAKHSRQRSRPTPEKPLKLGYF